MNRSWSGAGRARRRNDAAELELHLDAMRALGRAAYCRDPHSMTDAIEWAAAHVTEAMDVAAATRLLDRARALQAHGSSPELGGRLQALRAIVARDLGSVSELARAAGEELRFGDPLIAMTTDDDREPAAGAGSRTRSSCSASRRRPASPRSSGRDSGCWRSWPPDWTARAATRRRSAHARGHPSWCASAIAELRDPAPAAALTNGGRAALAATS